MSENQNTRQDGLAEDDDDSGMSISEMLGVLREHLKLLTIAPLAAGLLALGITTLIAPTFTAVTTFMPPQQSQSGAQFQTTQFRLFRVVISFGIPVAVSERSRLRGC